MLQLQVHLTRCFMIFLRSRLFSKFRSNEYHPLRVIFTRRELLQPGTICWKIATKTYKTIKIVDYKVKNSMKFYAEHSGAQTRA